jgi:hypothetical protein
VPVRTLPLRPRPETSASPKGVAEVKVVTHGDERDARDIEVGEWVDLQGAIGAPQRIRTRPHLLERDRLLQREILRRATDSKDVVAGNEFPRV